MMRGLSRAELAGRAGVSYAFIQQLESGTRTDPRAATLAKIAKHLGTSIDRLLHEQSPSATTTPSAQIDVVSPETELVEEIKGMLSGLPEGALLVVRDLVRSLSASSLGRQRNSSR